MKTTQNKKPGSESLQIKAFLPFSEDLMFHLMENFSFFQLEFGKKHLKADLSTVLFCIARIFWRNLLLFYPLMENLL